MRRYSEAVQADVRKRMSPPHDQSVAQIAEELGIHVDTLYNWRDAWRLQGEVVPASGKEPEGWSAADKFTDVPRPLASTKPSSVPTVVSGPLSLAGRQCCQRKAGVNSGRTKGTGEAS